MTIFLNKGSTKTKTKLIYKSFLLMGESAAGEKAISIE